MLFNSYFSPFLVSSIDAALWPCAPLWERAMQTKPRGANLAISAMAHGR